MYLVDSSVWIAVFRKSSPVRIDTIVDLEEVVTCLPVIQEVLQGFREETAFRKAREAMYSFPVVESPLTAKIFDHAVDLYRAARHSGLTVRSGIDCLIAACALQNNLAVLHKDRDFDLLSAISPLRVKSLE